VSDGVHRWFKKQTRKKGPVTGDIIIIIIIKFNKFATKDSCTWNITHKAESTAA
jgi:hypothetical protein